MSSSSSKPPPKPSQPPSQTNTPAPAPAPSSTSGLTDTEAFSRTNAGSFLCHVSPRVPLSSATTPPGFSLSSLWGFYDRPYGFDIDISTQVGPQVAHYVPHLSGVQLFASGSQQTQQTAAAAIPIPSAPPSAPASARSVDRAPIAFQTLLAALGCAIDPALEPVEHGHVVRARAPSVESGDGISVVSTGSGGLGPGGGVTGAPQGPEGGGGTPRLLFQWFETATPDRRIPLSDRIKELSEYSEAGSSLTALTSGDLDPRSWYAVHWLPILCHPATSQLIRGAFITYHRITALPQLRLPSLQPGAPSVTLPFIGFVPYKVLEKAWFATPPSAAIGEQQKINVPFHRIVSTGLWLSKVVRTSHPDHDHSVTRL